MEIELLTAPGCPHAADTKKLVLECLAVLGIDKTINERIGRYWSPTVLVDGVDVMPAAGALVGDACRLERPTQRRVLDALRAASRKPT